jgi:hypothetical protein
MVAFSRRCRELRIKDRSSVEEVDEFKVEGGKRQYRIGEWLPSAPP